jgi:hypothetical protein
MFRRFMSRAHLYAGLFISPFVVLYAFTAVAFNHTLARKAQEKASRTESISVRADLSKDNLPLAADILRQLGIEGEIIFVGRNPGSLYIPVALPGENITVNVDLASLTASVAREETGAYGALLYLHKSPGPHVSAIRGNWWPTRLWRVLADSTVLLTLFLTVSGIYLWLAIGLPWRTGFILAGGGSFIFLLLIVLLA